MNFEMTNNSAMWAEIDYKGTMIRVYNAHLETTGINSTLHKAGKLMAQGLDVEGNALMRAFYGNYTLGMIARSGQANVLAMDMRECEKPIIVCGDFNDVPYSYVYNTMLGDKVDGFTECGSGFMYTFRGGSKKVRIDYIFHDKGMQALSYYKRELTYSDHNPVFSKISLTPQQ
jgi:endonuclease/exonuclease/phosphatase family metal-dependent hydrolase